MFSELFRRKDFVLNLEEMQGDIHQECFFKLLAFAFLDLILHHDFFLDLVLFLDKQEV